MDVNSDKYNKENIKNLLASIINKQLGDKLKNSEQKNDSDIKELNRLSIISKDLIKNLEVFSSKRRHKINQKTNHRVIIQNQANIRHFSPSNLSFKKGKTKKPTNTNHNNINITSNTNNNIIKTKTFIYKKSVTPLKNGSIFIKKNNVRNKRDLLKPSKSIDLKKNKNNISNEFDTQSKCSIVTTKTFKKNKNYKTPVRKKNKNYFNKLCKSVDNASREKSKIDFDLTSLDNDIEITKISINFDENQETTLNEFNNMNKTRFTIRLGPLAEKIQNEKLLIDDNDIFQNNSDNFFKTIEYIFDNLYSFLDIKSFFNIVMLNKNYFKLMVKLIINKLENKEKDINKYITELKQNNKSVIFKEEKTMPFEFNNSSLKALSFLNSTSIENFYNEKKIDFEDNKIKLIFDLYFIALGKKNDIINYNFEKGKREKYIMNYFKNTNKKYIGNIIDNDMKKLEFNNEIINSLYEYSYNKLNIISPKNFLRTNKNITNFCYIIKNLMEYLGIIYKDDKNKNVKQIYNLFSARLHINKELIKRLKAIVDL